MVSITVGMETSNRILLHYLSVRLPSHLPAAPPNRPPDAAGGLDGRGVTLDGRPEFPAGVVGVDVDADVDGFGVGAGGRDGLGLALALAFGSSSGIGVRERYMVSSSGGLYESVPLDDDGLALGLALWRESLA